MVLSTYANKQKLKDPQIGMNQISRCATTNKNVIYKPFMELIQGHHYQMYHHPDGHLSAQLGMIEKISPQSFLDLSSRICRGNPAFCSTYFVALMMLKHPLKKNPGITQRGTKVKYKSYFLNLGQKDMGGHAPKKE